jgi:hypothetical protein
VKDTFVIVLSPPEGLGATCPAFSVVVMTTVLGLLASPLLVVEAKKHTFLVWIHLLAKGFVFASSVLV